MISSNLSDLSDYTPKFESFTLEEKELLEQLLFDPTISRNRDWERFNSPSGRRMHRISKHIRSIRKQLLRPDGEYWVEELASTGVCLHIHRPSVGLSRKVYLSLTEWQMLQDERWANNLPS